MLHICLQIVGEVDVPPVQVYPGSTPRQSLVHPNVVPASQISSPSTFPFPQSSQIPFELNL